MEPIPKSGLHYPNNIARIYLQAMEEVMGKNGLNAILNMASLNNYVDNSLRWQLQCGYLWPW